MSSNSCRVFDPEVMNDTELYQVCREAGISVVPGMPREVMAALLTGELEESAYQHPIDAWRVALIGFALEYWRMLEPQLTCPMRMLKHPETPDPKPCFGCIDAQVVTCVVENPENEHRIRQFLPRRD
jgi:hypothetical protein